MAQAFLNRCMWTAVGSGTGSFVVSAAAQNGYTPAQCLDPVVINGATYHYFAFQGTDHEEGDGVYTTGTSTLTRALIRNSSNAAAVVNFASPPIVIMGGPTSLDMPVVGNALYSGNPSSQVYLDASGNFATSPGGTVSFGGPDVAAPTAQTLVVPGVVSGNANVSGANRTEILSEPTGTGTAGLWNINSSFTGLSATATFTVTIASPAVFTITGHGYVPGQVLQFTTTGALPTGLSLATNYYVIPAGLTANAFEVSTTPGGAAVNTSGSQSGTHTSNPQTNVQNPASLIGTWGPSGLTGSQTTPLLALTQDWNTSGTTTGLLQNIINIASAAQSKLFDFQVGGTTTINGTKGGIVSATAFQVIATGGSGLAINDYRVIQSDGGSLISIGPNSANAASGGMAIDVNSGNMYATGLFSFQSAWNSSGSNRDSGLARVVAKVASFTDGNANANGWMQWAGQARVSSDQVISSTTTLANVSGLSVTLQAGRTYSIDVEISWTDIAAAGIQLSLGGTATVTNLIFDGWVYDSNTIKGQFQGTALGATAVNLATTTATSGHATIQGMITVNAAGTLTVMAANGTSTASGTTIKRGSRMMCTDYA
jgi:hypothetical protein